MTVGDEIFPAQGDRDHVQTQWARGWVGAVIGFGNAARMLTEQKHQMHASVDQIGLAVFFLQRHRVELVIKQALFDLGDDPAAIGKLGHDLGRLWKRFESLVRSRSHSDDWDEFLTPLCEFVAVIHDADVGSFNYRYPVDKDGNDLVRARFIDLEALERYAEHFESHVHGCLDWINENESYESDWA